MTDVYKRDWLEGLKKTSDTKTWGTEYWCTIVKNVEL